MDPSSNSPKKTQFDPQPLLPNPKKDSFSINNKLSININNYGPQIVQQPNNELLDQNLEAIHNFFKYKNTEASTSQALDPQPQATPKSPDTRSSNNKFNFRTKSKTPQGETSTKKIVFTRRVRKPRINQKKIPKRKSSIESNNSDSSNSESLSINT